MASALLALPCLTGHSCSECALSHQKEKEGARGPCPLPSAPHTVPNDKPGAAAAAMPVGLRGQSSGRFQRVLPATCGRAWGQRISPLKGGLYPLPGKRRDPPPQALQARSPGPRPARQPGLRPPGRDAELAEPSLLCSSPGLAVEPAGGD